MGFQVLESNAVSEVFQNVSKGPQGRSRIIPCGFRYVHRSFVDVPLGLDELSRSFRGIPGVFKRVQRV